MLKKHKVMIVDDHDVVRMGLTALLEDSEFEVISESGSVAEAVEKSLQTSPDVILMDVRLPDGSGVEACRQILLRQPTVRVLMLTSYRDEEAVLQSIKAGASGYVLKEIGRQALRDAIRKVVEGEILFDPKQTLRLMNRALTHSTDANKLINLTNKEREILIEVSKGKSNKKIAEDLFLSEYTVRNYVSSILNKLDLTSRVQLANYVFEKGLNH
ncbi:response regulator transcription factor [Desulfosporosinus nitroreducens]|uniref:Stage 0 sporulation protein A homolog n=1 Tax=Desulfosporosinus nitroreducens TaxID=2018668 RepID=A0ABT8QMD5_9FIRM|nr:response regulator transcription factor [Desulfosporosinus nitroreducens]MCO1600540.1 response regulator transcription factor [Desulfosporosinus nitroreducens]MDO0822507.1 response regulator transcription factor [Desulfosporosinus nitroreducens]